MLRRALALSGGSGKDLRDLAPVLLHDDDPLGVSLGYKAAEAARKRYNTVHL